MMNIACSTCLESFTSGCDISTTPCGHVFHTGCITRWLDGNINCSQCRKDCEISQIIKLYFSESQSSLEEQIGINYLEQKRLQLEEEKLRLEEEKQTFAQKLTALNKLVLDKSIEINQANQKCAKLEDEKLLMKLDWSKTEWNLKESINITNNQIKVLEKEIDENETRSIELIKDLEKLVEEKSEMLTQANKKCKELELEKCDLSETEWILIDSVNKAKKQIKDLEKVIDDQKMVDIRALQFCGLDPENMIDKNESELKQKSKDCLIANQKVKGCNDGQLILEIIGNLTKILNGLRQGIKSTYVLYNDFKDFWEYYLRKLSTLPSNANYEGHFAKLEMWLNILNNMNIDLPKFGQLTNDQHEQMSIDFNDAFNDLKERSNNSNLCTSCEENLTGSYQCTDCDETLCVKCFKAHSRLKLTRSHTVTPL
jgi:DNA repair exonuclease SbcCD ATPase subunit